MKHIALLRDDRPLWDDVTRCLRDVNVKITTFGAVWEPEDVIGLSPDMIVTNLRNLTHLKISLRRIPKIAIRADAEETRLLPASRLEWNLEVIAWPTGKDEFLKVTAKQLALSPRKTFACIFRVALDGEGAATTAQTVNLSMTGIAFKTVAEFEVGQLLRIFLDLPGERANLEAKARIIRFDEVDDDPRTSYGAEYVEPPEQFTRSMKRFIHTY